MSFMLFMVNTLFAKLRSLDPVRGEVVDTPGSLGIVVVRVVFTRRVK